MAPRSNCRFRNDAAANSGSQSQAHHMVMSVSSASPVFSIGGGIRVDFNGGRQSELSAKGTLQTGSWPARQGCRRDHNTAGSVVDLSHRAHAQGEHRKQGHLLVTLEERPRELRSVGNDTSGSLWDFVGTVTRCGRPPSALTIPPEILVRPMSNARKTPVRAGSIKWGTLEVVFIPKQSVQTTAETQRREHRQRPAGVLFRDERVT